MARGRFISESVATDARLNALSVEAQLVYLMAVPHLDRDGLISGDPDVLWGKVCPKRRQFIDHIAAYIQEWAKAGLVFMYDSDEGPVLWFRGFVKNQVGLRYERETPSKYPPPPNIESPASLRQVSGKAQDDGGESAHQLEDQVEVKDQVEVEVKGATPAATAVNDVASLWQKWDANMPGTKTPVIVDSVNSLLDDYSIAEIEQAITIACQRNQRNFGYVRGILQKGVFSDRASPSGGEVGRKSSNRGLAAATGFMQRKGMLNGSN